MKNGGNATDPYTDIPVAARIESEDTTSMQLADCPKVDYLGHALDFVAANVTRCKSGVLKSIRRPVMIQVCRIVLWVNIRRSEKVVRLSEAFWEKLLVEYRSRKDIFPRDQRTVKMVREHSTTAREILGNTLLNLALIEPQYPKLVPRMRIALERAQTIQCEYIPSLFVEDDPAMTASAQQHYEQDTLMDFETFADGLQRH